MDYKKNTPTGYLYGNPPSRITELIVLALLQYNPHWIAVIGEVYPTFPADNALNRAGQRYCSSCGWQSILEFGEDKTRSKRQKKTVFKRYCRRCDARLKREARERRETTVWYRG